ncbi:MAG: phosphoribosylanthranilate isomerase [Lachnospiraceae bacterium]|nr:phosphoribosylanthranilate isomerase [Lachnospiraceae bacterium]
MTKIKICGLQRIEDIEAVNKSRADYAGFIFANSRRKVEREQARILSHSLAEGILSVGVFVNQDLEDIIDLLDNKIIDIAQLHGQETEEDIRWLKERTKCQIIKAVSVKNKESILFWQESKADYLLLDQGNGGSGKVFDWNLLEHCRRPFFLAGGISFENVNAALNIKPYAIDVSSGVETDGAKDAAKIQRMVQLVKKSEEFI